MDTPSRRTLLRVPIAAVGASFLASCGSGSETRSGPHRADTGPLGAGTEGNFVPAGPKGYVNPSDPEVLATERKRGAGRVHTHRFTAAEAELDLGGRSVRT